MIRFEKSTHAPASCFRGLADQMAETMREMAFAGETVSVETLVGRGYSKAAIERFGAHAVASARRRSVRQIAS